MDGYMYCHYCDTAREPEQLDYSGYCVYCGTKAVAYATNDGPLAPAPAIEEEEQIEALTMDGEAVPIDETKRVNWRRRMSLGQLIGNSDEAAVCGTCLYGMRMTDSIVNCPLSHNRGAATHLDIKTPACLAYVKKVTQ